ncbi:MAG: DUF2852 domain-containing protein [Paracoccus sp. (in: a-proteobacteria)]|nr:DUF2852 domain-containing protein [Paracoccus sp. (in: a-proteobacteria)]
MNSLHTDYRPGPLERVGDAITGLRDWLDSKGKGAWLVAMILGFVFVWPLGLAILFYMLWSNRMFGCKSRKTTRHSFAAPTGNAAFDAYREETLKRLEDEHREFMAFLERLREAKDRAEFEQFMGERDRDTTPAARD